MQPLSKGKLCELMQELCSVAMFGGTPSVPLLMIQTLSAGLVDSACPVIMKLISHYNYKAPQPG